MTRPPAPTHRQTSRQKVLFIGGLGRSGSTLIEKLLNELTDTFAVGETIHLWERGLRNRERCGCGEQFEACEHWNAVGEEAFGGWENIDLDEVIGLRWSTDRTRRLPSIARAHQRGTASTDQLRYLDYLRPVLLGAAKVAGNPAVLLESSKHLSTASILALDPALDVRVLHLVRDPRGVAYSWTKQVERPEANNELMPVYSPARTAGRWLSDNLGFEALAKAVPTLRLHYEDFLLDPTKSLQRIGLLLDIEARYLNLDFLDGNTARLTTPMHSVAGNPMRFGGSEMVLRLDDAWRQKLAKRDASIVSAITAPLLNQYGYDLRAGPTNN